MSRDVGHRLGSRQDDRAGHADFEIHGLANLRSSQCVQIGCWVLSRWPEIVMRQAVIPSVHAWVCGCVLFGVSGALIGAL